MPTIKKALFTLLVLAFSHSMALASSRHKHAGEFLASSVSVTGRRGLEVKGMVEHRSIPAADIKVAHEGVATHAPQPVVGADKPTKRAFDLTEPIPRLWPAAMAPQEKIKQFQALTQQPAKNTRQLYHLIHDPVIKEYIKDKKAFDELRLQTITDDKNMTLLDHSIENNDAPTACVLSKHTDQLQRQNALRFAAQKVKPRMVLALLTNSFATHSAHSLDQFFLGSNDLSEPELDCYFAAHAMLKDHTKHRAAYYHKTFAGSQIDAKKKAPLNTLISDAQELTVQFLQPKPSEMNLLLEEAIASDYRIAVRDLLNSTCSPADCNAQGMDAITLAAFHGRPALVRMIMDKLPFIDEQDQHKILIVINKQLEALKSSTQLDSKALKLRQDQYQEIITIITTELPKHVADKNMFLAQAIIDQNMGAALKALQSGANPNARVIIENQERTIANLALNLDDPLFLKILLIYGLNPNAVERDINTGRDHPLTFWCCFLNKPAHLKLLLDYGADTYAKDGNNVDLVYWALQMKNPQILENVLNKNPQLGDTLILSHTNGKRFPLIMWAIQGKKVAHLAILLKKKANTNAVASDGTPVSWTAMQADDPIYLNMLLVSGANPNAKIRYESGKVITILSVAIIKNKPEHAQLLLDAGADPDNIEADGYSSVESALQCDNPIFLKMMLAAGLDKNTLMEDQDGRPHTLLSSARMLKKAAHIKILVDFGGSETVLNNANTAVKKNPQKNK
jgi:hypothetical protein